jgi:pyruvate-formate lyase-activating enzyme
MPAFETLEPAIDPNNKISFLLDWELTMKCNLDCSYCPPGLHGGHDNSTSHPAKEDCIRTLEFMFEYADQYMHYKPNGLKYVILNVYGGESLHHPDVVEILSHVQAKYQPYKNKWHLTVTTTTNAIVSNKKLLKIIPHIDEFTVSSHVECTDKQKQQFKDNLLIIRDSGKRLKCVVLMHDNLELFKESQDFISWLDKNQIRYLPKQIDGAGTNQSYGQQQIKWFNSIYQNKKYGATITEIIKTNGVESSNLSRVGRACCGGRQSCLDQNYKERHYYIVDNKFSGWYCSVNEFFLFVKQVNGEVYVNKDCKMNFDGTVGPIGNLTNADKIIEQLKAQLANGQPVIQCKIPICRCGLCAPKAQTLDKYKSIIKKYQKNHTI